MTNHVILVHGYSDKGKSFSHWKDFLTQNGYDNFHLHVVDYTTLTNEVTIKDIAEAFDKELHKLIGTDHNDELFEFDAIVHSTGMLVLRSWLVAYKEKTQKLKHLIGLAPATWGSPLAHKGRSLLGAAFKGKWSGPDFMEAGDLVLDALELGSRFTWDLAHNDLFGDHTYYGMDSDTPYVFTICGIDTYSGLRAFVNEPGMDGTVRWAGCSFGSRKIVLDVTKKTEMDRVRVIDKTSIDTPFIPLAYVNHGTILDLDKLDDPKDRERNELLHEAREKLQKLVIDALNVNSAEEFDAWKKAALKLTESDVSKCEGVWQQFVVHAVDQRGDPIPDYHIQLVTENINLWRHDGLDLNFHCYEADKSFRCFHLNLTELCSLLNVSSVEEIDNSLLNFRVLATANTSLVSYSGYTSQGTGGNIVKTIGRWTADLEMGKLPKDVKIFYPFTTTLIELKINRDPS